MITTKYKLCFFINTIHCLSLLHTCHIHLNNEFKIFFKPQNPELIQAKDKQKTQALGLNAHIQNTMQKIQNNSNNNLMNYTHHHIKSIKKLWTIQRRNTQHAFNIHTKKWATKEYEKEKNIAQGMIQLNASSRLSFLCSLYSFFNILCMRAIVIIYCIACLACLGMCVLR